MLGLLNAGKDFWVLKARLPASSGTWAAWVAKTATMPSFDTRRNAVKYRRTEGYFELAYPL